VHHQLGKVIQMNLRSEESYRMWRVVVCDQETSQARRLKPTRGL